MGDNSHLYAVIMAGGRGTRFWPLSRESRPKQVLPIAGPEPMIRTTVDRILPLTPAKRVLVLTGAAHAGRVKDILPDLPPENIIIEPVGRNTAPCIGLAAHVILDRDPSGIMIVLPADHIITKTSVFCDLVLAGASLAGREKALVTLGVKPTHPETGYGYIEAGTRGRDIHGHAAWPALAFHEKPSRDKAREYLADKRFYWNSGIFIWGALTILERMQKLMPGLADSLKSLAEYWGGHDFETAINRIYPKLESISIDHGVMEKAGGVMVLPADIGWSDVGSWTAAAEHWPTVKDNALQGQALFIDTSGCAVHSPDKMVALIGVKDLIVVETQDALLVCSKDRAQDIRAAVEAMQKQDRRDLL